MPLPERTPRGYALLSRMGSGKMYKNYTLTGVYGTAFWKRGSSVKERTINQKFQHRLAIIVAIAEIASVAFIFVVNTKNNTRNYENIICTTLDDIENDIEDTSDINMLEETGRVKQKTAAVLETLHGADVYTVNEALRRITEEEELSEMSIADADNIIIYSSQDEYIRFDMNANEDTRAFDALNHGAESVVQPVRENAYRGEGDYELFQKYAGIPLEGYGYLQIAISSQTFQRQIDEKVNYIAVNRHIGQSGYVIIANPQDTIVSNANGDENGATGQTLSELGLVFDKDALNETFTGTINGKPFFCMARFVEGYYIIGAVPQSEVQSVRNREAILNTITEIIIFALMFFCIYRMINTIIVSRIHNINGKLHKIIAGEMDTTVDEFSTKEFTELSADINSTVTSLKDFMAREQKKMKKELELSQLIQRSALPKPDAVESYRDRFELSASIDTAKEVGGDFYDYYMLDETHLAVLIADVSGKGIPAAMFMMICKVLIKNLAESGIGLDEVFNKTNEKFCESNDGGMFVTVWMGVLDLETGLLRYVNAGHNPPLFFDENGEFAYLKCKPGLILIGYPGLQYSIQETQLKHGDRFFLYTDGVTEANDPEEKMYGDERLKTYLNAHKDEPLEELLHGLKADIDRFAAEAEQFDDITMVAVEYK